MDLKNLQLNSMELVYQNADYFDYQVIYTIKRIPAFEKYAKANS